MRAMAPAAGAVDRVIRQFDRAVRWRAPAIGKFAPGIRAIVPAIGAVALAICKLDRGVRGLAPVIGQCPSMAKTFEFNLKTDFLFLNPKP